jgi:hypothetical protein
MRFVKLTKKERFDLEKLYKTSSNHIYKRTLPVFAFIGSRALYVGYIPYVENQPV